MIDRIFLVRSLTYRVTLAALVLSAVALLAVAGMKSDPPAVSAQASDSCGERYSLCLTKETVGGNGTFEFFFETRVEDFKGPCFTSADVEEDTALLSDGESIALLFKCALRITEAPQRGWQLVDIDCDYSNTIWEISPITNGVLIVYNPAVLDNVSEAIDCTFVNRRIEERQPLNLGGLFAGQPTPLPTAPSAVAPAATSPAITPPRTGDAGLK